MRSLLLGLFSIYSPLMLPTFQNTAHAPHVDLQRVPERGIQPQVAIDNNGTIHLVYFKGDPSEGDLFYVRSKDGVTFSNPIRVNSEPGSAVALGNIRGARIAVGRRGNVYIVWNGSTRMGNPALGRSPMLFSRLNDTRTAFEAQRDLIHIAYGIDGGGGVAADQQGRVYVVWHAPIPGHQGEAFRRVWMTRSEDDGKSFAPEWIAWDDRVGVCGCCSLNASVDRLGNVLVLFRGADEVVHRDMYLLESTDHGGSFRGSNISRWNVPYCVMSSEAFVTGPAGILAAWEAENQIHLGLIDSDTATATDQVVSPDKTKQKYPALAMNAQALVLASWTEGMSWQRGGSVHWRVFDSSGRPLDQSGAVDGVPAWSLVAAYAKPDGNFVVLF